MHAFLTTLAALILSIAGTATAANNDGLPQAANYVDSNSNITFLGYANMGFQFGMALPTDIKQDVIIQLVSPLKNGGGWGGVDFGTSMTGPLMVVAWPNTAAKGSTSQDAVMVSPRVATGYDVSNGANLYKANPIKITQIPEGTFVNGTHVSATFICGGCLNSDSFGAANTTTTFSYAFAYDPVADPADPDTALSDHTLNGEPYGPFDLAIAQAQSREYATWAAMTDRAAAGATATGTAAAGAPSATGAAGSSSSCSSCSSSSSSSSSGGSSSSSSDRRPDSGLSGGAIFALAALGLVYVLQAVQIL